MNTIKLLTSLTVTTVLLCSAAFAASTLKVAKDDKPRVEFALHGKTSCVMLGDRIFCAPATARAPIRLASSASD